jgi:hypothetical protein
MGSSVVDVVVAVVREGRMVGKKVESGLDGEWEDRRDDSTGSSKILDTVVSNFSEICVGGESTASLDDVEVVGVTVMIVVPVVVSGGMLITTELSPPVFVEAAIELELGYMVIVWVVTSVSVMRMRWKMR